MINKKKLLSLTGLASIGLIVSNYLGNYRICDVFAEGGSASDCPFILTKVGINLLPIIPLFLISLITYKMREEVYRAWFKFARWWIPLSMLAILIAPEYSRDFLYPIEKGSVAFLTSIAFLIISAIIVAVKFFSSKRT